MRRLLVPLTLLPALALTLAAPACGGASGSFRGNGTGVPVDPGQVRVINSKDDLNEPYKELIRQVGRDGLLHDVRGGGDEEMIARHDTQ